MASNLVWPEQTADRGRWKWMMQPVVTIPAASGTKPELYTFEKNPYKMSSPFAEIASADSSRQPFMDTDGLYNTVLLRTKFQLGEFSVDGKIWSDDQRDKMQAYYDWPGLVAIRDHFGRVFVVRLMDFDVRPVISTKHVGDVTKGKWEYKLQCQLWQFSESAGNVMENAANIGMVFNGFGPGTTSVDTFDAAVGKSNMVVHKQSLPSDWEAMSDSGSYRDLWRTHVNGWEAVDELAGRYSVIVLDAPLKFYTDLSKGDSTARHAVTGIAEALREKMTQEPSNITWGEMSIALGVNPHSVLAGTLSTYAGAFRNFKSLLADASPRLIPVARYPWTQMASSTFGGMLTDAPVACLYVRFGSGVSLATVKTNLAAFRRTVFTKGSLFALTISISGATQDGASPDEVLNQMYAAARELAGGQAQLAFFAYEDYVPAVASTPEMVAAYQSIYLGAETVTDEMLGRL